MPVKEPMQVMSYWQLLNRLCVMGRWSSECPAHLLAWALDQLDRPKSKGGQSGGRSSHLKLLRTASSINATANMNQPYSCSCNCCWTLFRLHYLFLSSVTMLSWQYAPIQPVFKRADRVHRTLYIYLHHMLHEYFMLDSSFSISFDFLLKTNKQNNSWSLV